MITCPNCHHQEYFGALFCSECGIQLVGVGRSPNQELNQSRLSVVGEEIANTQPLLPNDEMEPITNLKPNIALRIVDSDEIIHLGGRSEVTLGRVVEGQPILPDIDLSPYEAYTQGVSRLHAAIKITPQRVSIMDLGSSNGTRVNGQKIMPHVEYPLNDHDIVALGKLKIQVIIQ
ncbi:MAG: FHA domain-containing protein [Thermanaerothrix sp.]|uniref:FHA domain-containing protein n=1 Tax=Thermanaerothrix sp. TaxID=2972675 RepID=UPI003C7D7422